MKKVGLFGGTFNPPHLGHLLFAQEVLISFELDEIWFIPVNVPPHKESDDLASNQDRVDMLVGATRDNDHFHVNTIELEREGPSYTIDTMKQLKQLYPDDTFYFLIGGDMIEYLPKWTKIKELMELVTFIGVKRPGSTVQPNEYSNQVLLLEMPQIDISSTDIRHRVQSGKPITYMVPDRVEALVKERLLYEPRTSIGNRKTTAYRP
ncbi:nicotinate-nucleotide adenylyltransferase [Alkalihalobacillus sp. MEB130]|uniref:nicotinate-nucleotide adenylyltransferase n=1 Tax=Alkalihalobacillus sp. MEB130 TaxID=2976704 RepID=UPI0028E06665|nr:nicotinate-nucleotide adenylyltransferase [Alkalihalobacillus sp. MEB130]MDT8861439.1 nicotinate-nucleotide adenylyltransferase [Alkalihalobacillus sp. MEB130]